MWNTIKNELRNRGRNAKKASKATKTAKSKKRDTDDSSSDEEKLDPKAGMALVIWANMPLKLRKTLKTIEKIFEEFCGFDLARFRGAVQERFKLTEHKHIILELAETSNRGFPEAQALAAQDDNEGVFFTLKTAQAVLEEETEVPPVPLVGTPEDYQTMDETEHRRLAWEETVAEARNEGSNKLHLSVRLWTFSFLKNSSKADTGVDIQNMVIRLDDSGPRRRSGPNVFYELSLVSRTRKLHQLSWRPGFRVENLPRCDLREGHPRRRPGCVGWAYIDKSLPTFRRQ